MSEENIMLQDKPIRAIAWDVKRALARLGARKALRQAIIEAVTTLAAYRNADVVKYGRMAQIIHDVIVGETSASWLCGNEFSLNILENLMVVPLDGQGLDFLSGIAGKFYAFQLFGKLTKDTDVMSELMSMDKHAFKVLNVYDSDDMEILGVLAAILTTVYIKYPDKARNFKTGYKLLGIELPEVKDEGV